jgi:hypothetical protein
MQGTDHRCAGGRVREDGALDAVEVAYEVRETMAEGAPWTTESDRRSRAAGGHVVAEAQPLENLTKADADHVFIATLNAEGAKALEAARSEKAFTRMKAVKAEQGRVPERWHRLRGLTSSSLEVPE